MKLKWSWVGHIARLADGKWNKAINECWPRIGFRSVVYPVAKWIDDIFKITGCRWVRLALERSGWDNLREVYTKQWVKMGC